jgi:hypothetical protein
MKSLPRLVDFSLCKDVVDRSILKFKTPCKEWILTLKSYISQQTLNLYVAMTQLSQTVYNANFLHQKFSKNIKNVFHVSVPQSYNNGKLINY